MSQLKYNLNSAASKIEKAKRLNAFVVTSFCMFVMICLFWPFTVTEFRSAACINIATSKDDLTSDQFGSLLAAVIRDETVDQRLEEIIEQIDVAGHLDSEQLEFRDFESIRKSLQVSISERDYGYDYCLGYDGRGTPDEGELLQLLISRIAVRLRPKGQSGPAPTTHRKSTANTLTKLQTDQFQSLELANDVIDRVDAELSSVKQALATIGDTGAGLTGRPVPSRSSTQFQLASSKRVDAGFDELSSDMDLIDLQSLRQILRDMRERMDVQTRLMKRQAFDEASQQAVAKLIVSNPNKITTRPLHGFPGRFGLLLIGAISVGIGSIIAVKLKPFESRGFENSRAIGRLLDVPVVAQIRTSSVDTLATTPTRNAWWANRVATGASLILLAAIVVIGGFIAVNPEVRIAFLENPFYGCSRIVRIFAGY